ncbi:FecR family protein [Robertkochia flava]|uniref:FecR family protein n=1 Tax=Robertkochia flava TaxID=3447986 RepID=UPI001CC9A750|nr:FecR domain-containing protein [Robertkochia marina]
MVIFKGGGKPIRYACSRHTHPMEELILKYLANELPPEKEAELLLWLKEPGNKEIFKNYVKLDYRLRHGFIEAQNAAGPPVFKPIQEDQVPVRTLNPQWWRYAAVIAVLIAVSAYLLLNDQGKTWEDNWQRSQYSLLIPGDHSKPIILDKIQEVTNARGEVIIRFTGDSLIYASNNAASLTEMHQLFVPFGNTVIVKTSDASVIEVNAGSQFIYPDVFQPGEQREVNIAGEAYFKVKADPAAPFVVNAYDLNVEVLGTAFNVNAYEEHDHTEVVLVEGKVSLYDDDHETEALLNPGMMGSLERFNDRAIIETASVDPEAYLGWRNQVLNFDDHTLGEVLLLLERQYNVNFRTDDPALLEKPIAGSFKKEQLETVLDYLKNLYNLEYRIEDRTVFLTSSK